MKGQRMRREDFEVYLGELRALVADLPVQLVRHPDPPAGQIGIRIIWGERSLRHLWGEDEDHPPYSTAVVANEIEDWVGGDTPDPLFENEALLP